jgi:hypothetical protein
LIDGTEQIRQFGHAANILSRGLLRERKSKIRLLSGGSSDLLKPVQKCSARRCWRQRRESGCPETLAQVTLLEWLYFSASMLAPVSSASA